MTKADAQQQSPAVTAQLPSEGGRRFSGVWFAAAVAPTIGVLVMLGLLFAQVVVYAGAIVGIAVAAIATIIRSHSRGMPLERAYGLAVVSMLATAAIVLAIIVAIVVAYALVMKDF